MPLLLQVSKCASKTYVKVNSCLAFSIQEHGYIGMSFHHAFLGSLMHTCSLLYVHVPYSDGLNFGAC